MPVPTPYADAPSLPEEGTLDLRDLFEPRALHLELEIGPGRGGFVFERVSTAPSVSIVGIEIRRKWATIVNDRLSAAGLGARAKIFAGDIKRILPRVPSSTVSAIFVHFPDPWWKKRHRKRMVVTDDFIAECARVLENNGHLFVQTDVLERAEHYGELISAEPRFATEHEATPFLEHNPYGARSPRERRAENDGLPVYRLLFRRGGGGRA